MKSTLRLFLFSALLSITGIQIAFSQGPPVMNPIQGSATHCLPASAPLHYTASASNSPSSYTWTILGLPNVSIINGFLSVCTLNFSFPHINTTYTLFCQASNALGSSNTSSFVINVFETPTVTFSGVNNFCQGSGTNISASSTMFQASSTTISYNWSPSTGLNSTTSANVFANPPSTTNYTVLLTSGPCTNTNYFTVTVLPVPVLFATLSPTVICQGQSANLTLNGSATSFSLNGNPVSFMTSLSPSITTPYTIIGKNISGCSSPPAFVTLSVNPSPVISGGFNPGAICVGESSTLTLSGSAISYSINSVTGSSLVASPQVSTLYNVSGTGSNGCQSPTQQMALTVNPLPIINVSFNSNVICEGESISLGLSGSSVSYSINGVSSPAISSLSPSVSTNYTISGSSSNNCKNSVTQAILVNPCVGLYEYNKSNSFIEIFPNPSENGAIFLKSTKAQTVRLVNELGQTIRILNLEAESTTELSGLSAGIYFVLSPDSKNKVVVTR